MSLVSSWAWITFSLLLFGCLHLSPLFLSLFFCLFLAFLCPPAPTLARPSLCLFSPGSLGLFPLETVCPSIFVCLYLSTLPLPTRLAVCLQLLCLFPSVSFYLSVSKLLCLWLSCSLSLCLCLCLSALRDPCASLSSVSASLWGCPSPPLCSHPPLSAHRREQQPRGPGDTPSLVARVLKPGRGCGLITLMVSAVGTQPAQEMGHLSLSELIAACGHFSPAAFRQRAERGERGSKRGLGARGEQWREGEGGRERRRKRGEGGKEERRKMPLHLRPGRSWKTVLGWTLDPRSRAIPCTHNLHTPESTTYRFHSGTPHATPPPRPPPLTITDVISTPTHQDRCRPSRMLMVVQVTRALTLTQSAETCGELKRRGAHEETSHTQPDTHLWAAGAWKRHGDHIPYT